MSSNMSRIIRTALFTPTSDGWGLPLLFWGGPGVGKSAIVEGIGRNYGLPVEVLSPGERGEGAFGVIGVPDTEGYIAYPPPRWVQQFEGSHGGFLFVDELTTAPPAIQSALLGLLLKKRIGGSTLNGRVRILGAANPIGDGAGCNDLAPAVANRLGHFNWEAPSETEWSEWLMSSINDTTVVVEPAKILEARVMANWARPWAKFRGLVAGFIRANPALLHKQPPNGHPDSSRAWPSHRSWEYACRAMAGAEANGMGEVDGDMLAASFVGPGAIGELVEYRTKSDLPDPVDVLDGKVIFKPDFKRLDRTFAVLGSTTSLVMGAVAEMSKGAAAGGVAKAIRQDKVLSRRLDALIELLTKTSEGAIDLTWNSAKQLAKAGIHDISDDSKKLIKRMRPLIDAVEQR